MYVTVDIGGTNVVAALCTPQGAVVGTLHRHPTRSELSAQAHLDYLSQIILTCVQESPEPVEAVLIGFPSKLMDGKMVPCDNLPNLGNCLLEQEFSQRLQLPVFLAPDAICFAAGVYATHPKAQEARNLLAITLGTGVGVALILEGKPYLGRGLSGEIWKAPLHGAQLEDFVSAGGIRRQYLNATGQHLSVAEIAQLAKDGEPAATQAFESFGENLGVLLCYCVGLLDPDCICLGGGISQGYPLFERDMRRLLATHSLAGDLPIFCCNEVDTTPLLGVLWLYHNQ